jgi:hypothetical protein
MRKVGGRFIPQNRANSANKQGSRVCKKVGFGVAPQNRWKTGRKGQKSKQRKSDGRSEGLLRRQRHFILEKLIGQTDKDAALAAGYSLTVAANTKQKLWSKPGVRKEFERLKRIMIDLLSVIGKGEPATAHVGTEPQQNRPARA